jgi:hypothetical protein
MTNTQNVVTQVPHRSNTHDERFYHIQDGAVRGTVFFRKETPTDNWRASVSLCHPNDQFNRKTGRVVARRRYFEVRDVVDIDALPSFEEATFDVAKNYVEAATETVR